ncbi:hypothetical protein BCV70DRAFT_197307 [Testicularia cyperi]|uniref:Uncharacterized protein n=1 Tax=Testicularia cyperi TaxID=1882483 RepID=A0A317Y0J4_9BASI|nr:hypothetical protein BCV70DRAFT_197307 [Testicularia cyperi]
MSDGVSLRSSGRWSRSKVEPTTLSSVHRSPQEKWQRVAGMAAAQESAESSPGRTDPTSTIANNPAEANATAAAAATPPTTTRSASRLGMAASSLRQSQGLEQHEEWIGDVNRAILERDLKSSQEARRVQQHVKDGDYLLPVSDMHIASAHWTREDEPAPPSLSSAADQIAQGKTKIETKQPQGSQQPQQTKYQYPISDQFKDLEDIFMAAWDDGYGIAAAKPMPAKASAKSGSSVTKGSHVDSQADPDEIPITWTRASTHAPGKPVSITAENDVVDDTVPIHWDRRSTITDELAGMILDHENRRDAETDGKVSSGSQESQKKRVEAVPTHSIECGEPEQSVYTDFIPEEPKVSPTRQRNEHVEGVGVIESAMSAAGGDGGATATATADATTTSELEADLLRKLEQKDEELSRQRRQLHDLQDRLDTLQESCYEQEDEAKRRSKAIRSRVGELEHHLALFTVWADEVHRRLGLESPSFLTQLTKLGKKKL